MTGALVVMLVLAVLVVDRHRQDGRRRAAAERLRGRAARASIATRSQAGFHILIPFVDVIRYRHSLKETAVDIPEQVCITRDNVQVHVDGVLYLKVLNPERASYGISDYLFAISQLAQTTLRSEVGKIDLDRTFEERTHINIAGRQRARQGVRAVGRQGAALRDQEHHAAAGHPRRDGEADARRAREARGDPHLRGPARRGHQQRRRREAAGDQGVGGASASSRSTRPKAQAAGDPRGRRPPRPRASAGWPRPSRCRAASRPCSCASPSSTSTASASWPRTATRIDPARQPGRRRLDDRAGDERGAPAAAPGLTPSCR